MQSLKDVELVDAQCNRGRGAAASTSTSASASTSASTSTSTASGYRPTFTREVSEIPQQKKGRGSENGGSSIERKNGSSSGIEGFLIDTTRRTAEVKRKATSSSYAPYASYAAAKQGAAALSTSSALTLY